MKRQTNKPGISISELATNYNCDRATVRRHLSAIGLEPLAHDRTGKFYDRELANEALSVALGSGKKAVSKELRESKLKEEIRKLRLANDTKERTLILRAEHESEIREMSSEVQKQLYAIPPRAPELAGLPVAEIEAKLTEMVDAAVRNLADGARAIDPAACPLCQRRKAEVAP